MTPYDFAAWVSKLIALDSGGSDTEMIEAIRAFANECGVDEPSAEDLAEWFRFDEVTP